MTEYDEEFWRKRRQPGVSEADQRAANNALASSILEGYEPTEADLDLWDRYVRGEVSGEEYMRIVIAEAKEEERQAKEESKKNAEGNSRQAET
jgi:hypothetical protein